MALVVAVDDDQPVLKMIKFRLEREGHEVLAYDSARAALEAAATLSPERVPDVAVLDVMMPEKNGLELCAELRSLKGWEKIPVIFLSARVQPQQIAEGQALGATYLTKPFVATALLKAIRLALRPPES